MWEFLMTLWCSPMVAIWFKKIFMLLNFTRILWFFWGLGLTLFDITKDTAFAKILVFSNIFDFPVVNWTSKWTKTVNWVPSIWAETQNFKGFFKDCICLNGEYLCSKFLTRSNNTWGCKGQNKNQKGAIDAELIRKSPKIFNFTTTYGIMSYCRKKQTGGLRTWFFEKTPGFLGFLIYPWKFQAKQSFTPRSSTKLCYTPQKF